MTPISNKKLQELFAQLMRVEQHRSALAVTEIEKVYKSLLQNLQYYTSGVYAQYAADDSLTYFISSRQVEYARFLETVEERFLDAWDSNRQIITQTVEDVYKIAFNGMVDAAQQAVNTDQLRELFKDIRLVPSDVTIAAVTNPISHLTLSHTLNKQRQQVLYNIRRTISNGIIAGDRYDTMAKRIDNSIMGFGMNKAKTTVRTETHRVREVGHNNAADNMDNKLKAAGSPYRYIKTWKNMQDNLVRGNPSGKYYWHPPDHWDMENVTVLQDENFTLTSKKSGYVSAPCPGQSGTADNDVNCRCYLSRELVTDAEFYEKTGRHFPITVNAENAVDNSGSLTVDNDRKSGIINTGAISGALNPNSKAANEHAVRYYESVRHMKTDTLKIAQATGIAQDKIDKIKNHIFIKEHDLANGRQRFDPSYDMAVSWQRLASNSYIEKDIVLLKHEYSELRYMEKGLTQDEAHIKSSHKYNYAKLCENEGD